MQKKSLFTIMIVLLIFGLVAAGCGGAAAEAQPVDEAEAAAEASAAEQAQPADESAAEEPQEEVQEEEIQEEADQPKNPEDIVIGYDADEDTLTEQKAADLKQACQELGIQCVQGSSISELAEQDVDAIITFSNNWNVMGDSMEINDAVYVKEIPLYVLDAETDEDVYSLAFELSWLQTSLQWTFDQMGDSGKMVYVSLGPDSFNAIIQEELDQHPNIQATEISASYEDMSAISTENIAALVAGEPDLGAIWSSGAQASIFWGLNDITGDQFPAISCTAREEELQAWKDRSEEQPAFQCIASVKPGGNAYEAVYVAYYRLMGKELDPAALGGTFGNTLLYGDTTITNDNLDEWLAKIGDLRVGDWGALQLPPMTPEEILDKWFLD